MRPGSWISRSIASATVLLPQPLSPTRATISPAATSKLAPATALTVPSGVSYSTRRSRTDSIESPEDGGFACGIAIRCSFPGPPGRALPAGIEHVEQRIPDEIEGDDRERNHEAGRDRHQRYRLDVGEPDLELPAPAGRRRLRPEPEERRAALDQDRTAHRDRERDDERGEAVRQDVDEGNTPFRHADRAGGLDIRQLSLDEDLCPD